MKRIGKVIISALIVVMPVLAACSTNVSAAAANGIGNKVNCVCGSCSLTVTGCIGGGEGCATSPKQMAMIKKGLAAGHTEEQILHDMAVTYGQKAMVK